MELIGFIPVNADKNHQHLGESPTRQVVTSIEVIKVTREPGGFDKTI